MTKRNPAHPSAILQDSLDEMGWSVTEFSNKLGVSRSAVSRLMKGRCGITPMVALALERIGWSNADFWMRLQSNYDLAQARRELEAKATVGS
jgi:addiction module HigA family antidote